MEEFFLQGIAKAILGRIQIFNVVLGKNNQSEC